MSFTGDVTIGENVQHGKAIATTREDELRLLELQMDWQDARDAVPEWK